MQNLMGCEEELGFDITTLNALAITVTIVTTIFQMKKIRLREVYSLIQQTFIEHLLCARCYTGCWRNSCELSPIQVRKVEWGLGSACPKGFAACICPSFLGPALG